ncbi:MAG: HsmA family protein [Eggerthellales bacterium]|nr:HsmA family protein [Eggerthellales bacterium]
MSLPLMLAVLFICGALVFYTIGVMWERHEGELRPIHFLFFILGVTCDTIGTSFMGSFSQGGMSPHLITGAVGLALMAIHAIWAAGVLLLKSERAKHWFHKFSIAVWLFWLIPFSSGMLMGLPMIALGDIQSILAAVAIAAIMALIVLRKPRKA